MKVKRPNAVIYFIIYIFLYPFLKIMFRLEVDRSKYTPPKGPFIVLANHASFIDFLIVMLSFYPRRLNAVTAQKYFLYKPLTWFLPAMGCIPKNLFDPDIRSIIGIKKVLNSGGRILMFPEGRCGTDGAYAGMHKSAGKLIKNLGVPVVTGYSVGTYTCMPFWRSGLRFGRIQITLENLFDAEQLKTMSVDEVNIAIDKRLCGLDTPLPIKPLVTFGSKRLAEGLDNILYLCPKCNHEFTMETKNCTIKCLTCDNTILLDRQMNLKPTSDSISPESIHKWFVLQARYESSKLSEDMEPITIKAKVKLPAKEIGAGMETCGSGIVKLDATGWYFDGQLSDEQVNLFFPINTVPALPFDPDDVFQIYANGTFYMFEPEDKKRCVQYSLIGECAYWKFASPVMMTAGRSSPFES